MVIYAQGWNMGGLEARWSETMYKRLYWQKFNGTVCLFDWEDLGFTAYDSSEENAWRSSLALSVAVGEIKRSGLKGEITLFAHSQGNIVAGEYLRAFVRQGEIKNYIATQAAISGHFYDGSLPEIALNLDDIPLQNWFTKWFASLVLNKDRKKLYKKSFETPNIYANFKNGTNNEPYMKDNVLKTNLVNFSNPFDWALRSWKVSNITRPNSYSGYVYKEGDNVLDTYLPDKGDAFEKGTWIKTADDEAIVNRKPLSLDRADQRYKIFAQCSESRSLTLGQSNQNVKGFSENFDLSTNVGYTDQHYSHSREFRSNIIDESVFWKKVFDRVYRINR